MIAKSFKISVNKNLTICLVVVIIILILTSNLLLLKTPQTTPMDKKNPTFDEDINENIENFKAINKAKVKEILANMQGFFTKNQGQLDNNEIYFTFSASDKSFGFCESSVLIKLSKRLDDNTSKSSTIKLTFENSNKIIPVGNEELNHKSNYFIGNDSSKWKSNVLNYEKIVYENLYDGIDLVYYFNEKGLKYDWIVKPNTNPNQIIEKFDGIDSLKIDSEGDLIIKTEVGELREGIPYSYQHIFGNIVEVETSFKIIDERRVTYKIGDYDYSKDLIIDPLIYSTFVGGNDDDVGNGIALDSENNAYITGGTKSSDFPIIPGCYNDSYNGGLYDIFVIKLTCENLGTGNGLVYSTFVGGRDSDIGKSIALDYNDNAYVIGNTQSDNFPTTPGCFNESYSGKEEHYGDVFVFKLNSEGSDLLYSTYIGSDGDDEGKSIALDSENNAYITGRTHSENFPTTPGCFDDSYNEGDGDVFVSKLNSEGSNLTYSTFIGDSGPEIGYDITLDFENNAYIAGETKSENFPTTPGCYDDTNDYFDAFVFKLSWNGTDLLYSTFVGGSQMEYSQSIVIDSDNNTYVTGLTKSSDFPTTPGCFDDSYNGGEGQGDVFVFKLNWNGSDLVYSTFVGGNYTDVGTSIVLDSDNNVYITGSTYSPNFPTTPGCFDNSYNGEEWCKNGFIIKLNWNGSNIIYSTYIGGNDTDRDIVLDSENNVYITGYASTSDFPTTSGCYDDSHNGNADIFVLKLNPGNPIAIIESIYPNPANESETVYFFGNGTDDGTIIEYYWNSNIDGFLSNEKSFYISNLSNGTHKIILKIKDNNNTWSKKVNTTLTINGIPRVIIDEVKPNFVNESETVYFYGNGTDDGVIEEYFWNSSIDGFLSNEKSFYLSNLSNGTHTIYFKAKDNNDTWSNELSKILIINGIPRAKIEEIKPNCGVEEEIFWFYGNVTDDGTIEKYIWNSNLDGFLSSQKTFSLSNLSVGEHNISFKVEDNFGFWSDVVYKNITILKHTAGVSVEAPGNKSGNLSEILTYIFKINNTGNSFDSFNLTAISEHNWAVIILEGNSTPLLDDNESIEVFVNVTIPNGIPANTTDNLTLTAISNYNKSVSHFNKTMTTVNADYGVNLSCNEDISFARPNESASFEIIVTNIGNIKDKINLSVDWENKEWKVEISDDSTILQMNEYNEIFVFVTPPLNGSTDEKLEIFITGTSENNTNANFTLKIETIILQIAGVDLISPENPNGNPFETVFYNFTLFNKGNGLDSFNLTAISENNWNVSINEGNTTTEIQRNENITVTVELTIPPGIPAGSTDNLTLTAISNFNESVFLSNSTMTTVNESYGVNLSCLSYVNSTKPGVTKSYEIKIMNVGNIADIINLSVNWENKSWEVLLSKDTVNLDMGEFEYGILNITPPSNATAYEELIIEIIGESQNDLKISSKINIKTIVEQVASVNINPPPDSYVDPNQMVTYNFLITNLGNYEDEFLLSVNSFQNWDVEIIGDNITPILKPNESVDVDIRIFIPSGIEVGTEDILMLSVKSVFDNNVTDSSGVHIIINIVSNFTVITPSNQSGYPFDNIIYDFEVWNYANGRDDLKIEFYSSNNWDLSISGASIIHEPVTSYNIQIEQGKSSTFQIRVNIPFTLAGTKDILEVKILSTTNISIFKVFYLTTTVNQTYGLYLKPLSNIDLKATINQSESAKYTITIENRGNGDDYFGVTYSTFDSLNRLNISISEQLVLLKSYERKNITVLMKASSNASAGSSSIRLSITSKGNASVNDSYRICTTVNQIYNASIECDITEKFIRPNYAVVYSFVIKNTGNGGDTVKIEHSEIPNGWKIKIPEKSIYLWSGKTVFINITITAPKSTSPKVCNLTIYGVYGERIGNLTNSIELKATIIAPDVIIKSIIINIKDIIDRDEITITALIHNIGDNTAHNIMVTFYTKNGQIGEKQTIQSLYPNSSTVISIKWKLPVGKHEIYVSLQLQNEQLEYNNSNNELSESITVNTNKFPYFTLLISLVIIFLAGNFGFNIRKIRIKRQFNEINNYNINIQEYLNKLKEKKVFVNMSEKILKESQLDLNKQPNDFRFKEHLTNNIFSIMIYFTGIFLILLIPYYNFINNSKNISSGDFYLFIISILLFIFAIISFSSKLPYFKTKLKLEKAKREADETLENFESASNKINLANNSIIKAEKIGIDVKIQHDLLLKAVSEKENNDYKKAIEYAINVEKSVMEQKEKYLKALNKIDETQSLIEEMKILGIDTSEVNKIIENAKSEMEVEKSE